MFSSYFLLNIFFWALLFLKSSIHKIVKYRTLQSISVKRENKKLDVGLGHDFCYKQIYILV